MHFKRDWFLYQTSCGMNIGTVCHIHLTIHKTGKQMLGECLVKFRDRLTGALVDELFVSSVNQCKGMVYLSSKDSSFVL